MKRCLVHSPRLPDVWLWLWATHTGLRGHAALCCACRACHCGHSCCCVRAWRRHARYQHASTHALRRMQLRGGQRQWPRALRRPCRVCVSCIPAHARGSRTLLGAPYGTLVRAVPCAAALPAETWCMVACGVQRMWQGVCRAPGRGLATPCACATLGPATRSNRSTRVPTPASPRRLARHTAPVLLVAVALPLVVRTRLVRVRVLRRGATCSRLVHGRSGTPRRLRRYGR